jgi:TonB-linked SusC/RagA family outer membrane protein
MLLGFSSVFAQSKLVTGVVTDVSGSGLSGVSISVYGSFLSTSTDLDGKWEITVTSEDSLVFSFAGMDTKKIKVEDKLTINLVLKSEIVEVGNKIERSAGKSEKSNNNGALLFNKKQVLDNKVSGVVTDISGLELPGVSVTVYGSLEGTSTDLDGRWELKATADDIIVFSFIGMETRMIEVNNQVIINLVLEDERVEIEEMVVTAYGLQKKASLVGAVDIVKKKDISDIAISNVEQMLQGKVSGVDITANSGAPGSNTKVIIRGMGSISATTNPLYVIDGMRVMYGNHTISPNDIESLSVLKDASAVALYGARGSNGVILITTKKGLRNETRVRYSGYYGVVNPLVANYNQMNSSEILRYQRDLLKAGVGFNSSEKEYKALEAINTNWKDEILQKGSVQSHNVSISGGGEDIHFYLGYNNYNEQGILKDIYFKKNGVVFNADHSQLDWLKLETNINLQTSENRFARSSRNTLNPFRFIYSAFPFEKMYNADGSYNKTSSTVNPVENTVNNPRIDSFINFVASFSSDIKIYHDLHLVSKLGLSRHMAEKSRHTRKGSHLADITGDSKWERNSRFSTYLMNHGLVYKKTFDFVHAFSAKGILEYQKYDSKESYWAGKNFPSALLNNLVSAAEPTAAKTSINEWNVMSYILNINYDYDDKYITELSLRTDGSSRFGKDHKFGNFWALGLAWNMHKEDFLQDVYFINKLKLRGSLGTSGNDQIGYYDHLPSFSYNSYDNNPAGVLTNIGNPDLRWELTSQFSAGLDFSLFDDRIYGTVEFYSKITKDLLLDVRLAPTTGFSSQRRNVGELSNTGLEFSLNAIPIETEDFYWNIGLNLFTNKSVVNKLAGDDIKSGYNILREGEDMMSYYLVRHAGVNPATGVELYYTKDGEITNKWSSENKIILDKSPFPDYSGNISNQFNYKGIGLSFTFFFKQGNFIYNQVSSAIHDPKSSNYNMSRDLLYSSWQKPGDITSYPKVGQNASSSSSTLFLEDASYLRLRDLNLSYSLPSFLLKRMHIENLTFSIKGHNLWTYAPNFTGPDPEVGAGGENTTGAFGTTYDYTYPATSSYTFGLALTF